MMASVGVNKLGNGPVPTPAPLDWKVGKLKYFCDKSADYGLNISAESYADDGVRFLRTTDIDENGNLYSEGAVYLPPDLAEGYELHNGDLLFSRSGTIGRSFTYNSTKHGPCSFAGYLVRFRCGNELHPKFLFYWSKSDVFIEYIKSEAIQSTIGNFNGQKYANIYLLIPPYHIQQAIADFLDRETARIDELIAKKQRQIGLLQEKRAAVISHAVTKGLNPDVKIKDSGIEWLGEVPEHWSKAIKLQLFAKPNRWSFVNGPFGSDLLTEELTEDGVPVVYIRDIKIEGYLRVSTSCVTEEKADELRFCSVKAGDVLVAKVGNPPGTAAVYPPKEADGIVTQDVIRIRPNGEIILGQYLAHLLNSHVGQVAVDQIAVEGTRKRVSLGDYKNLKFMIPPIEEQRKIIDWLQEQLREIDKLREIVSHSMDILHEYRSALISVAVTGKIDVRKEAAA